MMRVLNLPWHSLKEREFESVLRWGEKKENIQSDGVLARATHIDPLRNMSLWNLYIKLTLYRTISLAWVKAYIFKTCTEGMTGSQRVLSSILK